jgi:hypothetical protein
MAPPALERSLAPLFGPEVASGISKSYAWLHATPHTSLLAGTDQELSRLVARPPLTVAGWARATLVPALHDWTSGASSAGARS